MKRTVLFSLIAAGLLATGSAFAGTATTSFTANVNIAQSCSVSAQPIDFGSNGILADTANGVPGADNIQVQGGVNLYCTAAMPVTIQVQGGGNGGTSEAVWKMVGATNGGTLGYRIYQDAAYTTPFKLAGDQLTVSAVVGTQFVPLYGEILGSDNSYVGSLPVQPDSYSDTATVTVTY